MSTSREKVDDFFVLHFLIQLDHRIPICIFLFRKQNSRFRIFETIDPRLRIQSFFNLHASVSRYSSMLLYIRNSIPVISITALYIYLAAHIKSLFHRIAKKLRHLKHDSDFHQVLQAYRGLVNALNCMDDIFSYSVFILVLNSMVGLFRSTYSLVFLTKTCFKRNFYYCFSLLYYFIILTSVIVYASETIQAGRRCRELVMSLPGMFPHRYLELKILIRKNFKGESF
ncbi:uncharacterized protein CEXT_434571 [Caerostris extrusa]|uniref:Gustatory receptor n=1 Tax=Caerostris extrusa TaxID=172846 RepID=A0AAV4RAJ6_CAEEX|nr:uncharacterized protein CEXT_434571 [Caerostris extrusa]